MTPSQNPRPLVAVFGAYEPRPGDVAYEQARGVGDQLGRLGYSVITGGYGGVMEAASRGAVEAGGEALGVICTFWGRTPNRFVTQVVPTDGLDERIGVLVDRADGGYVILPGATGTVPAKLTWRPASRVSRASVAYWS